MTRPEATKRSRRGADAGACGGAEMCSLWNKVFAPGWTWLKNSTKSPVPVAVGLFSCIYPRKRMYEPPLISQLIFFHFPTREQCNSPSPHVNVVTSLFLWACFQETGLLLLEEDVKTGAQTQDLYSSVFRWRHFTVTYQLSSLVPATTPNGLTTAGQDPQWLILLLIMLRLLNTPRQTGVTWRGVDATGCTPLRSSAECFEDVSGDLLCLFLLREQSSLVVYILCVSVFTRMYTYGYEVHLM